MGRLGSDLLQATDRLMEASRGSRSVRTWFALLTTLSLFYECTSCGVLRVKLNALTSGQALEPNQDSGVWYSLDGVSLDTTPLTREVLSPFDGSDGKETDER